MKIPLLGILIPLLGSCASYDELWAEAEETGDWSEVNAYEDRQRAKRQRNEAMDRLAAFCKEQGTVVVCRNRTMHNEECGCLDSESIRAGLDW